MSGPRQRAISERWGVPFWDLLRDLAAQDLSRAGAARALGYESRTERQNFYSLLARNPDKDPWPSSACIPAQYAIDSGEPFRAACERLAKTHTISQAAREIGYSDCGPFIHAMKSRGITVQFGRRKQKRPPYAA